MDKLRYEVLTPQVCFPVRDVARVRSEGGDLVVAAQAFGPSTYKGNLKTIGQSYVRSDTLEPVSFRPATFDESLLIATADSGLVKREVFDPRWLQMGRIAKASQGAFLGVKGDEDEAALKRYLGEASQVGDLYVHEMSGVVFVPYETFNGGVQDAEDFVMGGLARGLERTLDEKASNLAVIASKDRYPEGVNVWGFGGSEEGRVLHSIVGFDSYSGRFGVGGDFRDGGVGFAFGVQASSEVRR